MYSSTEFVGHIESYDAERASSSYLMSLVVLIAGLPLPIINLVATFIFFMANRKGSYFTRFHCTQALFSQLTLFFTNSFGFWWTVSIWLSEKDISNDYIAYIIVLVVVNILEFVATLHAAITTRKRKHVELWVFGPLTHLICKPDAK